MITPVRLQLSRRKGFNLQTLSLATNGLPAIKADRSTNLGSPFPVIKTKATRAGVEEILWVVGTWNGPALWVHPKSKDEAVKLSVDTYRAWINHPSNAAKRVQAVESSRGKNIACWCKSSPCHADVLLELANGPVCEPL